MIKNAAMIQKPPGNDTTIQGQFSDINACMYLCSPRPPPFLTPPPPSLSRS